MDGFFDKYGRVIIIAVAICFVLLYLTPMRNVVGSSINGFAGNFANKVGESLGTVKMPDGRGNDGSWETPDGIEAGKWIKIDGETYIIMKQTGDNKFSVYKYVGPNDFKILGPAFNDSAKGKDSFNIYEGSDIDNYLEKTWYPSLSDKLKNAIELAEITQASYNLKSDKAELDINNKYNTNFKGQKYNTLKRHVYLPSVEDLSKITGSIVTANTRDAIHSCNDKYFQYTSMYNMFTYTNGHSDGSAIPINPRFYMSPAFIVDLSKVDYELVN